MVVARAIVDGYPVGKLVDVVGLSVPFGQTPEIFVEGIPRLAEVAVDDGVQLDGAHFESHLVHLGPDGVLYVVVDAGPLVVFAFDYIAAQHLVKSRHLIVVKLVSHREPLLDYLDGRLTREALAFAVEVPGA